MCSSAAYPKQLDFNNSKTNVNVTKWKKSVSEMTWVTHNINISPTHNQTTPNIIVLLLATDFWRVHKIQYQVFCLFSFPFLLKFPLLLKWKESNKWKTFEEGRGTEDWSTHKLPCGNCEKGAKERCRKKFCCKQTRPLRRHHTTYLGFRTKLQIKD